MNFLKNLKIDVVNKENRPTTADIAISMRNVPTGSFNRLYRRVLNGREVCHLLGPLVYIGSRGFNPKGRLRAKPVITVFNFGSMKWGVYEEDTLVFIKKPKVSIETKAQLVPYFDDEPILTNKLTN